MKKPKLKTSNNPEGRPPVYRDPHWLQVRVDGEIWHTLERFRRENTRTAASGRERPAYRAEIVADALRSHMGMAANADA